MSYYKTIAGKKYDKNLIELADELALSAQGGVLKVEDAQKLAKAICDGEKITSIEKGTFSYILDNYTWEATALQWLKESAPVVLLNEFNNEIQAIKDKFELHQMEVKAPIELIEIMNCRFSASVSFYNALQKAIESILYDDNQNSPRSEIEIIINNVFEIYLEDFKEISKWENFVTKVLKERMNRGYLELIPIWEEIPEAERLFQTPENQEPSSENWIFYLGIETDGHHFWTIVDRQGVRETFTYGYN